MPNDSIDAALAEVYALAPNDSIALETLELSNSSLAEPLRIVRDRREWEFTIEGGEVATFLPVPYRINLPSVGGNGVQDLTIAIDNIDHVVTDLLDEIAGSQDPVTVTRRVYLSDDPTTNRIVPPPRFFLTDIQINAFEVIGRASFLDVVNQSFPNENYTRDTFPSLG